MYVRASLEEAVFGGEVALLTARRMLTLWQKLYKEQLSSDTTDSQSHHHTNHDTYSIFNMSDKDAGKLKPLLSLYGWMGIAWTRFPQSSGQTTVVFHLSSNMLVHEWRMIVTLNGMDLSW